uniref:Uncharacterized protein n=1 Tax=Kuenenia stuttgartiensis TaxID=174633 RepID=Q1Q374_KUEST|nr:unknown protein [Candidatus Kuenenia stuttgartiensis]
MVKYETNSNDKMIRNSKQMPLSSLAFRASYLLCVLNFMSCYSDLFRISYFEFRIF